MPSRRRTTPVSGGIRRKSRASADPDQPELFAQQLQEKMLAGIKAAGIEETLAEGASPTGVGPGAVLMVGVGENGDAAPPGELLESAAEEGALAPDRISRVMEARFPESGEPVIPRALQLPVAREVGTVTASSPMGREVEPLPARMLNEFVYCPRLFYYEHVEGVFVESADTVRGATIHARVDQGSGALPKARKKSARKGEEDSAPATDDRPATEETDEIHSRSVMLGSERLGVVAKMDLVEMTVDGAGEATRVQPVDYKVGSPRAGEDGSELWDTDRMQLGLQCLVLRDNGYACDSGLIYYRGTKQRVRLELTPELEAWIVEKIAAARVTATGPIPPPLADSPKCVRCSLAPICLPDETRMLSIPTSEKIEPGADFASAVAMGAENAAAAAVARDPARAHGPGAGDLRRLIALRDEKRALYLNTQGFRVGCQDAVLKVKEKDRLVEEVRVLDLCQVAIFGNIQISTQAIQRLCDQDIPVTWFSMGGWFYGITRGHSLKNVSVRIAQFRHAGDAASSLRFARQFVRGKIHNHRVMFMRNHTEPPDRVKLRLGQAREDALAAESLEELLGIEGAAAAVYFEHFGGLLRQGEEDDLVDGIEPVMRGERAGGADGEQGEGRGEAGRAAPLRFDFTTRNRRPPTDPVNALLSLAYSLLAKECTLAAASVGLDPYVGFYHQPRHGRPALALDVMEEFRPLIAESAVLTAINNRYLSPQDFVSAGRAVNLTAEGRKLFFQCFEQRMNALIIHPIFEYKVSYRRALELQFRILARVLTGEIPEYLPFLTR